MTRTLAAIVLACALASAAPADATETVALAVARSTTGTVSYNGTPGHGRLAGHVTVAVAVTGSASVQPYCVVGNDAASIRVAIGSAITSSGVAEVTSSCSDVELTIASVSGTVSLWVVSEW